MEKNKERAPLTSKEALQLLSKGYNCSQTVLCYTTEKYGLDRDMALRAGCCFGGGCYHV